MTKPVRFLPGAETELRAAAEWYDDRTGLGDELLAEVQVVTSKIIEMPGAFVPARGVRPSVGAREAVVKRFPYRLIFVELEHELRVVAVAHARRRPGYWRDRLGSESGADG
ncbi:MAG: type II toxin-antitoxin system RelE/ParE family toxin [Planctomycetes bacterium]|nr:type II toxin-antitoxin system RelE/ParE family toxin [Planctomycetota bacterium]